MFENSGKEECWLRFAESFSLLSVILEINETGSFRQQKWLLEE